MKSHFSTKAQLDSLVNVIHQYLRLPLSDNTIPGSFLEGALAYVRKGQRLNTYDFVDVINREEKIGWQVKSTKSNKSEQGLKKLGDAIINFCNEHAEQSIKDYGLEEIYYSRLVVFENGNIKYIERKLCDKSDPRIFNRDDYTWHWSTPKKTVKKEQLQALHGYDKYTNNKVWSWHGLGENQLHFSGEKLWWTAEDSLVIDFKYPKEEQKLSLDKLVELLINIKD